MDPAPPESELIATRARVGNSGKVRFYPTIHERELVLGQRLGEGGFCRVYDLVTLNFEFSGAADDRTYATTSTSTDGLSFEGNEISAVKAENEGKLNSGTVWSTEDQIDHIRRKMVDNAEKGRYAVKRPKSDLPNELEKYKAVVDIQVEGSILMKLNHRNIITVRAISQGINEKLPSWKRFYRERQSNTRVGLDSSRYFLILDRLSETLTRRLQKWAVYARKERNGGRNQICGLFTRLCKSSEDTMSDMKKDRRRIFDLERILVALSIASAIQYLHHRKIVYRDLKPDNVGFNERGVLKLFDFGLAKQIHSGLKMNDLYSLTGCTGSLRYMAPEVARKLPYDYRVDSYSFGLLFWQICKLSVPFDTFTIEMHSELVVHKGYRPDIDHMWPLSWRNLITSCWHGNIQERPNFDKIVDILQKEKDSIDVQS